MSECEGEGEKFKRGMKGNEGEELKQKKKLKRGMSGSRG